MQQKPGAAVDPPTGGHGYAYRPALDGIRGLAVAAVVLFHGGVAAVSGGFLGVDAFFVLSGFLITSLLLAEHARHGRVRLGAFWARRARRLLPALLLVLVAVAVIGRRLLPPSDSVLLRGDALAALGYVANWRMIYRGGDYFAQTAGASTLQHTWSLGIEEQFYLLWPLLATALLARWGLRRGGSTLLVCGLVGAAGSAAAAWLLYRPEDVNRAYFGTDTRAQALLIGCALAIVVTRLDERESAPRRHRLLGLLALAGALIIGYLWTHGSGTSPFLYHGGFTLASVAVAAVLLHAVRSPSAPTARLLSVAPLVLLGRVSYGVYLWHWPLFQFLSAERTGLTGPALLGLRCLLTLAAAVLSYLLVERPFRRGLRLPARVAVPITLGAVAVCAATVLVATPPSAVSAQPDAGAPPAMSEPPMSEPPVPAPSSTGQVATPSGSPGPSAPMLRPGRPPGAEPRVEILGDSVAWTVGAYLPAHPGITVANHAIQGCGITLRADIRTMGTPHRLYPYCPAWPDRWQSAVDTDHPDVTVILLNRWELMDAKVGGGYQHVGEAAFDDYLLGQLDQAVAIAGRGGAHVVLLTASYTRRAEKPDGGLYPEDRPERVDAWNAVLRRAAAAHPDRVTLLDLASITCPGGAFTWTAGGVRIRSDGLHFTPAGVRRVIAPWLLPRVVAIARGEPLA